MNFHIEVIRYSFYAIKLYLVVLSFRSLIRSLK